MNMTDPISKAYLDSAIVMKGDYPYFINPISDGNPAITKELLDAITDRIVSLSDLDCDVILAPEAMAIPYATAVSLRTGKPFQVIRKRSHGLEGEISVEQSTGYSTGRMYLNFLKKGMRVIIIDDVISTGGTFRSIVNTLRSNGIIIEEAIFILDKSKDIDAIASELGLKIHTILKVAVRDGAPVILE